MLTTKEFIREVKELGLKTSEKSDSILIYDGYYQAACVYKNELFSINTSYAAFDNLSEELKEKLYSLIDEYARTPLDEREEPQRVYLKSKIRSAGVVGFLNFNKDDDCIENNDIESTDAYQTSFTQKEIDEIKTRFGVTLSDYRQIPVDEYWEEDED